MLLILQQFEIQVKFIASWLKSHIFHISLDVLSTLDLSRQRCNSFDQLAVLFVNIGGLKELGIID